MAKGGLPFGKRPMVHTGELKPPGQALRGPGLQLQRAGAEEHHAQPPGLTIPQALDHFRPVGHFLDFIDHQQGPVAEHQGALPLRQQPAAVGAQEIVGVGVMGLRPPGGDQLAHARGLAHLTRAHQHLHERRRLAQALHEPMDEWALEGVAHDVVKQNTRLLYHF